MTRRSRFLKDDKITDELKLKDDYRCANMEFERAAEYLGFDPGYWDPADQTAGHGQGWQNRDVFWLLRGQGLDVCRSSLSVRALIERDAFPYYNDPDEISLTYVGQFYQRNLT